MVGTSRVNREVYARFCGRLEVKSLRPTRRQKQIPARHVVKHIGYCQARCEYRGAGMDRTAMVKRVIEIESVRHAGVHHGSVWCRQPSLP